MAEAQRFGQRLVDDPGPVASAWFDRLQATSEPFSRGNAEEWRPICQAYIHELGRYLVTRDERGLRALTAQEAAKRFQVGFPADDLVAAYRGLQDLLWDRAGQGAVDGDPVKAGLWNLSGAIAVSVEETVKVYQQLLDRQIAEQRAAADELTRQLERSASIDDLTGLFSPRVFQEYLPREIHRADRYQRPLSLVVFDVDDFSRLLDLCGTAEGDRALRDLALFIPGRVREVDIMCRLDADEFAVILPETPVSPAGSVAERIREAVEQHAGFAADKRASGPVRISAGIAGFPGDAVSAEDLVVRAREACRHAKHLGKNQVVTFANTRL